MIPTPNPDRRRPAEAVPRRRTPRPFLILLALALAGVLPARADITVRISVKAVLNPATGLRQPGVSNQVFSNTVAEMNGLLQSYRRGYRLSWVGNALINVGGLNQFSSGPSRYYGVDFVNDSDGDSLKTEFETNAIASPATYGWDPAAINLYIVQFGGANWNVCSFPGSQIILLNGMAGYASGTTVLHEIGHYFNLLHTFSGRQNLNNDGSNCTNGCGCAVLTPGGQDLVADTILDHECWESRDDIALGNYRAYFNELSPGNRDNVDRIWFNVMSYHGLQHAVTLCTPDQNDRWTDSVNSDRTSVRTGRTRFVATTGSDLNLGTSTSRYRTVSLGVATANHPDDVVLLRAGNYAEALTITKPLTLRATRGNVLIGTP